MSDYKTIVAEIVEATENIKDEKIKEIVFQRLLDHSLGGGMPTESVKGNLESRGKPEKIRGSKKNTVSLAVRNGAVRDEVKKAFTDISPKIAGLKSLKSLSQKWEKYIWVLVVAKEKSISAMTNNEIAWVLLEKFSVGASEKSVNNLTFKVEAGFVQKTDINGIRAWKVLDDGIELTKD